MKFKDLQLPSNRSFGIFFSLVFLVASAYFLYLNLKIYSLISLFAALFFILILLINPNYLEHLNRGWMYFGYLIGRLVSPIVLGFIFFVVFTPLALALRIFQRDELLISLKDRKSTWKIREELLTTHSNFKRQF